MTDSTEQLLGKSYGANGPRATQDKESFGLNLADMLPHQDLVTLNVGGERFVTSRSTLTRFPDSRLSDISEGDLNFNPSTREWFFDRNPVLFNFILDYYRSDELHFPHTYCGPSIKKELLYWKIDESDISPCCWNRYREFEEEKKIFDRIDKAFESKTALANTMAEDSLDHNSTKLQKLRRKLYIFFEEPMSSRWAQAWTVVFLMFVLSSIGILCIETIPDLRRKREKTSPTPTPTPTIYNMTTLSPEATTPLNKKMKDIFDTEPVYYLEGMDSFLTWFFTIEYVIRFVVAPQKSKFLKNVMNFIDVLCVMPMWIKYIMKHNDITLNEDMLPLFFFIMMLRVLRICRVLRLARHYTGVKILILALTASMRELFMLVMFVFIVILIFAVVIYYAEFFVHDTFATIPDGYWWAIITITTVGYGDMYPKSAPGYVVGALCALTGILATGLPVPIIANNFNLYYSKTQMKEALMSRKTPARKRRALSHDNDSIGSKTDNSLITNRNMKPEPMIVKEATV